jgi:hypothetical protein
MALSGRSTVPADRRRALAPKLEDGNGMGAARGGEGRRREGSVPCVV